MTIYDSLHLVNKTFGFYVNTTVPHGCDSYPKACDHSGWSELGDANYPDVMMDGVARHQDRFFDYADFYAQAANGTLPNFVWIAPNNSYSDHPCNDVALGERLTKDIYEAVRAGPGWNRTLLAVLYDVRTVLPLPLPLPFGAPPPSLPLSRTRDLTDRLADWVARIIRLTLSQDAGDVYDHVVPPYAATDDAPCNVGNRPGPGPPPSPAWCRPPAPPSATGTPALTPR